MGNSSRGVSDSCSVAWLYQVGRSKTQRGVSVDGYRGEYPYASVTVVAENLKIGEDDSSSVLVETVRDVFAEGVAFGVEDVLRDAFTEAGDAIREKGLAGCSAAALAFSGTHLWYSLSGNCRLYKINPDEVVCLVHDQSEASALSMSASHKDYLKKVMELTGKVGGEEPDQLVCGHARIRPDTTFLVMTSAAWMRFENVSRAAQRGGMKNKLTDWLAVLSRELKLAYRRQGGALAAVSGRHENSEKKFSWKLFAGGVAFLAFFAYLLLGSPFSCGGEAVDKTDLFSADSAVEREIVQPISVQDGGQQEVLPDSVPDSIQVRKPGDEENTVPDFSDQLPLQVVQVGGSVSLNPDTFAVSLNAEPDIQWENYSPGIYVVGSDSASAFLVEFVKSQYPALNVFELDRIVTVRQNGVAESSRWLSNLPAEDADKTGIVVETRSSVAGGADWIRNYPVFVNGDRAERAGEAGGYVGDSLPGLPALRNTSCYRLIVVPGE